MIPRQQFGVGAVIRLNDEGRKHFPSNPDRLARVARFCREKGCLSIIWDGESSIKSDMPSRLFNEVVPAQKDPANSAYGFTVGQEVVPNESYLMQFPKDKGRVAVVVGFGREENMVWIKWSDRKRKTKVHVDYLQPKT